MPKVVQFSYYPLGKVVSGGQRRSNQLRIMLEAASGSPVDYMSLSPRRSDLGPLDFSPPPYLNDWTFRIAHDFEQRLARTPGLHPGLHRSLRQALLAAAPDLIWLEHPFNWSMVNALTGGTVPLVYSSHNIEWQMKEGMLKSAGIFDPICISQIREAETSLARAARLVVCCSPQDAEYFSRFNANCVVISNGHATPRVREPAQLPAAVTAAIDETGGRIVLSFVSSNHQPNWFGLRDLVLVPLLSAPAPLPIKLILMGGVCSFVSPMLAAHLQAKVDLVLMPGATDDQKDFLLLNSDAILLPITSGGGTNLKTAEALLSGIDIIGTTKAFRGHERYAGLPRVRIADTPGGFLDAIKARLDSAGRPGETDRRPRYEPPRAVAEVELDVTSIQASSLPLLQRELERIM